MPLLAQRAAKCVFVDVVAVQLILQVGVPVDPHGAGDVSLLIEQNVFVRFDDADVRIVFVLVDPSGADQDFGMGVFWHGCI